MDGAFWEHVLKSVNKSTGVEGNGLFQYRLPVGLSF